jgi:hypothetical protein
MERVVTTRNGVATASIATTITRGMDDEIRDMATASIATTITREALLPWYG